MRAFVTGGAGFIGSHLVDKLLKDGHEVTIYDNLSTGYKNNLKEALENPYCRFIEGDILDLSSLIIAMKDCTFVFHLAANADVRHGLKHPKKDLEQNTIGTFNVLEAMRINKVSHIAFTSTGSIYGEAKKIPTPENYQFPIQTSLYGASKLAGEGLIQAYCEGYGFKSYIFRLVSVLGERYSHGHVFDFVKRLSESPNHLNIFGNGYQKKSYIYVKDLIDAFVFVINDSKEVVNIYNVGADEYCTVRDSLQWITKELKVRPKVIFSDHDRGWIGDNPFIFLDTKKIRNLGWKSKLTIKQAVIKTVKYLKDNQ